MFKNVLNAFSCLNRWHLSGYKDTYQMSRCKIIFEDISAAGPAALMGLNSAWPYRDSRNLGIMGNTLRVQNEPCRLASAPTLQGVKEVTATRQTQDADNYSSLRGSLRVPLCFGSVEVPELPCSQIFYLPSTTCPKECFL